MSTQILEKLQKHGLIRPPSFVISNLMYLAEVGSHSYGVATEESDWDCYGICIPPIANLFPHLEGKIHGFDDTDKGFEQWQEHHIWFDEQAREYDFTVFNITKAFILMGDNNPNMVDFLFVPRDCILHTTKVGEIIRDNRKAFLHKGLWYKYRGYAYSQLTQMEKIPDGGKRLELYNKFGFDTKFAYHTVRLLQEGEMLLRHGEMDLRANKAMLISVRNGEMKPTEIREWATKFEHQMEELYFSSSLPDKPDWKKLKKILLQCIEEHYGSLSNVVHIPNKEEEILHQISKLVEGY